MRWDKMRLVARHLVGATPPTAVNAEGRSRLKAAAVFLVPLAVFAFAAPAQAELIWMSPTVNDGSFESWTSVLTSNWDNSEDKDARTSGVWEYGVTDNSGNAVGVDAGNLGALRPIPSANDLRSDGSIGFFCDPSNRKITLTSTPIALPVGVAAGDTLSWSYDANALAAYNAADSFMSLGIDFGSGVVNFSNDPTLDTVYAFETFSGNHVLTPQDVSGGTFSVEVVIHNIRNNTSGRLFVDNINLSSVPEPSTLVLLLAGGLGLAMIRRRK
jgi:hypothetical protein